VHFEIAKERDSKGQHFTLIAADEYGENENLATAL